MQSPDDIEARPDYGILLPCTTETFADFVSGLLGSAQTIERRFFGTFSLTKDDVESIYHLVQQRVAQQNEASLVEFSVQIVYEDESSVRLNSVADFRSYTEVRSVASTGVHMTWVYLIRFRDKSSPEKQQIDLTFHAGHSPRTLDGDYTVFSPFQRGHVMLRIAHTARTWGVDLESLLSGHIEDILLTEPTYKRFIYRHSGKIGLVAGLVALLIAMLGAYLATQRFASLQIQRAFSVLEANPSTKIDFLVEHFAQGAWSQFTWLVGVILIGAVIGSIVIGIWVAVSAENRPHSFVLLSRKAEERRHTLLKQRRRKWWLFIASLGSAILAGLIANALFALTLRILE